MDELTSYAILTGQWRPSPTGAGFAELLIGHRSILNDDRQRQVTGRPRGPLVGLGIGVAYRFQ